MDSLPFSQSDLGTQGEGPCFMVRNSQVEESQDVVADAIRTSVGTMGPSKQRMLWELAALRGTQPSPVLTAGGNRIDGKLLSGKTNGGKNAGQTKEVMGQKLAGSQPTDQPQGPGSNPAPNQADDQCGNAAGNEGVGGGGTQDEGQNAAGGAAGGGGNDGGGGGGGGDSGEEEEEEDEEHEETGEETSQDTSSNSSSLPTLVRPPALNTPPRTVRVKEITGGAGTSGNSPTSPEQAGLGQSDDDPGAGSERGGGVSDAPTAVVGDSTDEGQGAVTSPSPPMERTDSGERAGGVGLMDPPLHATIPKKRSSDTSHSSVSSSTSTSRSSNSSSYLASHDNSLSSLSTSLSSGEGVQATSLRFTQIKEHPTKPTVPIPAPHQSLKQEGDGEVEMEHPQSSQQDLFSDVIEERKDYHQPLQYHQHHRVQVLANETSTSDDASVTVVPPSPEAYKTGIQETPPDRNDETLRHHLGEGLGGPGQRGGRVLANETSASEEASVTVIQPSPEAWGTVIASTPPDKIEQYSRSTHSSRREGSDRTPSTPSETLGSLRLSGQQAPPSSSEDSFTSIVPPTLGAYGSIPKLIPSTPTALDEEEPMELSLEEKDEVAMATHPSKRSRSAGVDDDEYGIPEWQQVLNEEQQVAGAHSSSNSSRTSSSSKTSSSSQQSSESFGRSPAQWKVQQSGSFQAWQPSSQQTTSATSEENPRSRPPSTLAKRSGEESDASQQKAGKKTIADKPRSITAMGRQTGQAEGQQEQRPQSEPSVLIPETSKMVFKKQPEKPHQVADESRTAHPATPQSHQEVLTSRLQEPGDKRVSSTSAGLQRGATTSSSLSSQEGRQEGGAKQAARGGLSDEWVLHFTPTQTETEPEVTEEGAGRGRGPAAEPVHIPAHPATPTSAGPHLQDRNSAIPTTDGARGGEAAHTLMSYTDATSSSTTASSDAKKKTEDDEGTDKEKRGAEPGMVAPTAERSMRAPSIGAPVRRDVSTAGDPQQSISPAAAAGVESHSIDPTEYSSIDFHLSVPTDGGLRPVGGTTLPQLVGHQRERSSSRQPIRHSTPIAEESEDRQHGQGTPTGQPKDQEKKPPQLPRSNTLTLGVDIETDTQESTQTPVFQLERPSDVAQLLKAAHESPNKKSTSVFSKVQETKRAASKSKVRGRSLSSRAARYTESDDPFALSQDLPTKTPARLPSEATVIESDRRAADDDDDEETIPVHYQEEEEQGASRRKTEGREEMGEETAADREIQKVGMGTSQLGKGKRKAGEGTPKRGTRDKPGTPSSSNRLTRSGRKRTLLEEGTEGKREKRGGTGKKMRFEEGETKEPRVQTTGARDPYDFSDSQSNKTPSPMKKGAHGAGPAPSKANPRVPGPSSKGEDAAAANQKARSAENVTGETAATESITQSGSATSATPKSQKKDKTMDVSSPAQQGTRPAGDVAAKTVSGAMPSGATPSGATPKRQKSANPKSASVTRTSSGRGRRGGTGRPRLASQQVLQVQQEEDSSPDFQPGQPRDKEGVKFRRSPRKKHSQKQEKPTEEKTTSDPPLPRKHVTRRTVVYRVVHEEIVVDGKVVKTWETREQIEPVVETVEDEDILDLPSPTRSVNSLTSGSLGDVSSMYSKTSGSSPSLGRSLSGSGGTLSKHSSFSSISRSGSSLSKQTVSSPGSDKSTPSPGKDLKTVGGVPSPGVAGPSIQRRVSFTRTLSKSSSSSSKTSSGSSDHETSHQADQTSEAVFQKPQQTPRRKTDQQQSLGFVQRMSLPDPEDTKSGEVHVHREGSIPASKVVELVQLSQESVPAEEVTRQEPSSKISPKVQVSRKQTKDAAGSSSSPASSPSRRKASRGSSTQREDIGERAVPRTRSTPARATTPPAGSPPLDSPGKDQRLTRRSRSKDRGAESDVAAPQIRTRTSEGLKVSSMRSRSPAMRSGHQTREQTPPEERRADVKRSQTSKESIDKAPDKEGLHAVMTAEEGKTGRQQEEAEASPDSGRSTPRASRGKARGAAKKSMPAPASPGRPSTPPQQATKPVTSEPSSSFPRDTLLEPPPGETLPVAEGEVAVLLPGLKVYTKWLDGFWYPGTIHCQEKASRYVIQFDDGDHRTVNERDIIIKEWLSRGQSVMAEDVDGFYYAGTVVGYYKDPDTGTSGYVIEQTVSHETSRYERRHVILTKDQAASLVSSTSSSSSTSGTNVISLDNVVYSKRTRLRSRHLDSPTGDGKEKPQQQSPRQPQRTAPSRQSVKRKLAPSEDQQKKETPSPRKRGRIAAQEVATPSPDISTSPRRSPRKRQQRQQQPQQQQQQQQLQTEEASAAAAYMGPLPKQATLFRNHAFLVTHGEVRKPPSKDDSSSDSSDEGSADDEVEMVPFDRAYAIQQIQAGGGVVLSNFDKSQITKMKVLLIANTYCRTKKYFQALAASIPCISHLWLRDCCRTGRLQNYKSYLLPAGESLEEQALMEIQPNRSILAGMSVYMVSDYEGVQDTWRSILIAAGCRMVSKLPSHLEFTKNPNLSLDCNVIVTDPSCPRSLLHRARQLDIPVVSCEWVIQCLINGVRVPYQGHHKYAWNYREKSGR